MVGTVRPLRLQVLLVAALLALAGCEFFSWSIFPDELRFYEKGVDLSGGIPEDRGWSFNFRVIRDPNPPNVEYLVLVSDDRSFVGTHLAVFDASLNQLGSFAIDELDAMDTVTLTTFNGRGAMVDAAGMIVAGNRRFAVVSGRLSYVSAVDPLGAYGLALLATETAEPNILNLRAESTQLVYRQYALDWASYSEPGWPIDSYSYSYKLLGAWLMDADVVLLLRSDDGSTKVLQIPRSDFATASLSTPLTSYYQRAELPEAGSINWDTLGCTDEGFAAFRYRNEEYFRFDLDGTEIGDTWMPRENPTDEYHVYGRTSGWFVYDATARTVSRSAWWWQR